MRHCDHSAAWSMTIDVIRELRHFCLCSHFCKRLPSKRKWYFYTKISHKPRAQNISSTAVVALHRNTKGRLSLVLWAIVISKIMVVLLYPKGSSITLGINRLVPIIRNVIPDKKDSWWQTLYISNCKNNWKLLIFLSSVLNAELSKLS